MINIIIQHSIADMNSGASHSLLGMVRQIKKNGKYNPIVIIPYHNNEFEKNLNAEQIEYYVVESHDMWSVALNDEHKIKTYAKELLASIRSTRAVKQIKSILIERNVKLVHVNMLTCGLVGQVAEKLDIPVIWHMREFLEKDIGAKIVHFNKRKKIINKSKKIIAISHAVKKHFMTTFTPPIEVVYNGISFSKNDVISRSILTENKVKVAIVGRICKNKGQFEIVKALESLHNKKGLQYILSIYGNVQEPEYKKEIQEFISMHHAEERILFMGSTPKILSVLKNQDILGVCANMEAFGRTTIEGMISGCLVIGADSGGTSELIDEGITGYKYVPHDISDLASVIWNAIQNKDRANEIAKQGQAYASATFTAKRNAEKVMKIYDDVLGNINQK